MELFPVLEQTLADQEATTSTLPQMTDRLDEMMTVNRVLQQYPRAKAVFDQLFINLPYEGCDCLDEVAWRHGMESRELLETLERALGTPAEALTGEACACR